MAESGLVECATQKAEIGDLLNSPLQRGDTWYLIDSRWFKQWKQYVGYDSWDTGYVGDDAAHPGAIDNKGLLREGSKDQLKEHLIEEIDHMLVPEEAWKKLLAWYGLTAGQLALGRRVIEQGMFVKHCKVEVYLMDLKLCSNADLQNVQVQQFSRVDTIEEIETEMRSLFNIPAEAEVRLWNKYMSNTYERLNKPSNTVQDAGLYQGQIIVIEQKSEDGTWPRQTKVFSTSSSLDSDYISTSPVSKSSSHSNNTGSNGSYHNSSSNYSDYRGSSASPGLCGLSNLGNTCFMNSALQCMSNVPELTDYFLSEQWMEELNADNPLGMKGEIATSYAELVRNIWSGKFTYTIPRNFKIAVGRFAPQFSGYQQQDCQELMAFLLDGLNEDLNRIKKKPYVESKDYDGRPDGEVAQEAWENYLKRNDSVITDIFHGLLKSTLVCPECNKISITFDPFCYLSLPLPVKKERQIEVFLVPDNPQAKPRRYKLTVPKLGLISDLCKALSKVLPDIPPERMVVTDVYNHRFHKLFSPDEMLTNILDKDDIFIYEVPVSSTDDPQNMIVSVYLREKRVHVGYNNSRHVSMQLFGQPLLVSVPRNNCTYDILYNCVLNKMSRYVKTPEHDDIWWESADKKHGDDKKHKVETTNGMTNGEVVMTNGDAGSDEQNMDKADEPEEEGEGGDDNTPGEEEQKEAADETGKQNGIHDAAITKAKNKARLFSFHIVNSYGTMDVDDIEDDGKVITFQNRSYLSIDWKAKAKDRFYDDKLCEEFEEDDTMAFKPVQKRAVMQLSDCLNLFTTTETLGAQDPWYCPQCKKHQQATKKFDLWSLPKVLVIHLKRFSYNRYLRDKIDTLVEFPTRGLDLKGVVKKEDHGPALYDLLSVANHYGGMGGGHYTAYAKNKDNSQWYHFDDSSVSETSEESVVTKSAYVLVYKLRDLSKKLPQNSDDLCDDMLLPNSVSLTSLTNSERSQLSREERDMDVN